MDGRPTDLALTGTAIPNPHPEFTIDDGLEALLAWKPRSELEKQHFPPLDLDLPVATLPKLPKPKVSPRATPRQQLDALVEKVEKLRDDGFNHTGSIEKAIESLDSRFLQHGGGGPSSPRSQISQIGQQNKQIKRYLKHEELGEWPYFDEPEVEDPQIPTVGVAIALHDFDAEEEHELSCKAGDMLTILKEDPPDGWLYVRAPHEDQCGLVPASFVEVHVRYPSGLIEIQREQIEATAIARHGSVETREREAENKARKYLGLTWKEWRALPPELKPAHLLTTGRNWDGKRI